MSEESIKQRVIQYSPETTLRLTALNKVIKLYEGRNLLNTDEFLKAVDKTFKFLKDGQLPEETTRRQAEVNERVR